MVLYNRGHSICKVLRRVSFVRTMQYIPLVPQYHIVHVSVTAEYVQCTILHVYGKVLYVVQCICRVPTRVLCSSVAYIFGRVVTPIDSVKYHAGNAIMYYIA